MYFKIVFIQCTVQPVLYKLPRKAVFNHSIKMKIVSLHELITFFGVSTTLLLIIIKISVLMQAQDEWANEKKKEETLNSKTGRICFPKQKL